VATYIAWAANGRSHANTVTKAAVFTVVASVLAGCVNMARWRWENTNRLFLVTCVALVVAGGISTLPDPAGPKLAPLRAWALAGIAVCFVLPIAWLIVPVPAGQKYRRILASAMHNMADAVDATRNILMGPIDPEIGLLACVRGKIDADSGEDEGLKVRAMK
jgi:hypothetical protein